MQDNADINLSFYCSACNNSAFIHLVAAQGWVISLSVAFI